MIAYINAAGTAKTFEEFYPLLRTPLTYITVGTYDGEGRAELPGGRYYAQGSSLNHAGMPGPQMSELEVLIRKMVRLTHGAGKKLRVSIGTANVSRCIELIRLCKRLDVDEVELNLSCPNLGGVSILSYDLAGMQELFVQLWKAGAGSMRLSAKISPLVPIKMGERTFLEATAQFFNSWQNLISTVVSMNTWPNGYLLKGDGTPVIAHGYGGVGGDALKALARGQFLQLRALLDRKIEMHYVGGVRVGEDLRDCERMGASAVQVCTTYLEARDGNLVHPEQVFARIVGEYNALKHSFSLKGVHEDT